MQDLSGRVAVITGAASGIGRATALRLAEAGSILALSDIQAEALEETAELVRSRGGTATTHIVDVADRERMHAFAEEVIAAHGHVHILINNAGVAVSSTIEEHSWADFDWIVGINFWGVVHGCRVFLPYMKRESEGHIVNLSSLFGLIGLPTQGAYCATKAAVRSLSETLLAELRGTGIGVTSVHPGGIQTNIVADSRSPEAEKADMVAQFERFGVPPDYAAVRIVNAIRHNKSRLRICRETYVADWMKRLLPNFTNRLVGIGWRRSQKAG
jgi:NAD(P)-dependent dehydrogenase (short-subunit alcohol dehydrogenase family)